MNIATMPVANKQNAEPEHPKTPVSQTTIHLIAVVFSVWYIAIHSPTGSFTVIRYIVKIPTTFCLKNDCLKLFITILLK